jgi:hypothetical protein
MSQVQTNNIRLTSTDKYNTHNDDSFPTAEQYMNKVLINNETITSKIFVNVKFNIYNVNAFSLDIYRRVL